jgi:transposase
MREQDERGKLVHAEKRGKLEVAKNLKKMGFSSLDIKIATGLSDEDVDKL